MTVSELIEYLKTFPEDAPVTFWQCGSDTEEPLKSSNIEWFTMGGQEAGRVQIS